MCYTNYRKRKEVFKMSRLQDAYRMVYNDMLNSECGLLIGRYDAKNGSKELMYGIDIVMEWIAYRVSEADGDAFSDLFLKNMSESEKKY
jgi:hypothetical protein